MEKQAMKINNWKDGITDSLPILIGYIPIAMAFGILAKSCDLSLIETGLFSIMVFAGASQFIALNLLIIGVGIQEIILTTLLVNFRHFLMGASITTKLDSSLMKWKNLIAFGITDELFSVLSFKRGKLNTSYVLVLEYLSYFSWVFGTIIGYLAGGLLPKILVNSMGIALYAMFIAILVPEIKKSISVAILAISSGLLNYVFTNIFSFAKGWSIILSIVIVSFIGSLTVDTKDVILDE